ncbi:carboxypeptidase-like regulatory domain-containing protein [Maribacter dokdonensis]|uniref:carboxypeptidase-like regulatory domain-containing protein n=1 Tax=Maribacter dokdonensis TaxID=320912 RepID=UPI001C091696|nr:carboxypeptidase-like regulatory domain-containing protein [Maribacter dokdonensis]MBU2899580.1 carboxypeptidase-like regulatory domain-containing protein [Maribacter dokdonensis]
MPKYIFILIAISLTSFSGFGQDNTVILKGTVSNAKNDVSNVLIVNLNTQQSTITDTFGFFSIEVRLKDSLRISAVQYLPKEIIINESYLNSSFITIHLIENIIDLKEVTVTPYNLTGELDRDIDRLDIKPTITSYTLGLQNADVTKMTQSERLLQEADRGKYVKLATTDEYGKVFEILGYAALTVVINTHKIANRVSGRTKSLKKMVERDEKKQLEKEIIDKFSKQTMSENFKIPVSYIDGFLTYCLSQDDFIALKNAGNTIEIWEYLKTKSIDYKTTEEFEN